MLLANMEQTSAMLGSGTFKNVMLLLLVVIAVMSLAAPALLAKFKTMLMTWVRDQLGDATTFAVSKGASLFTADTPQPIQVNIDDVVKQRAAQLKQACPQSSADLRLKWLEQGYDDRRAQADYIAVLEQRVADKPAPTTP